MGSLHIVMYALTVSLMPLPLSTLSQSLSTGIKLYLKILALDANHSIIKPVLKLQIFTVSLHYVSLFKLEGCKRNPIHPVGNKPKQRNQKIYKLA